MGVDLTGIEEWRGVVDGIENLLLNGGLLKIFSKEGMDLLEGHWVVLNDLSVCSVYQILKNSLDKFADLMVVEGLSGVEMLSEDQVEVLDNHVFFRAHVIFPFELRYNIHSLISDLIKGEKS